MTARLNLTENDSVDNVDSINHPHVNYNHVREEEDPFPDTSLLDPIDSAQYAEVVDAIQEMVEKPSENGLLKDQNSSLRDIFHDHADILRTFFISSTHPSPAV